MDSSTITAVDHIFTCPTADPAKFGVKLQGILVPKETLAKSNCTDTKGRELLDQKILIAIKCKYNYHCVLCRALSLFFF